MEAKKLFFKECHLAGRQYHDADEVWNELKVGTILQLERDTENRFDGNAVQVIYENEQRDDRYLIGYIPREDNEDISAFLDMGWGEIFECRISKINSDAHYENQIRLTIRIVRNNVTVQAGSTVN